MEPCYFAIAIFRIIFTLKCILQDDTNSDVFSDVSSRYLALQHWVFFAFF